MHFKNFMSESNEECTDKHSISNISEAGWGIMVFNATSIYQLYRGSQFYWWRKPEYPEKTTDLSLTNFITLCCSEYT
jgi:hypothetical protein